MIADSSCSPVTGSRKGTAALSAFDTLIHGKKLLFLYHLFNNSTNRAKNKHKNTKIQHTFHILSRESPRNIPEKRIQRLFGSEISPRDSMITERYAHKRDSNTRGGGTPLFYYHCKRKRKSYPQFTLQPLTTDHKKSQYTMRHTAISQLYSIAIQSAVTHTAP